MFKKLWNWLFGVYEELLLTPYNFHEDFKEFIPCGESVLLILDIARYIQNELDISYTQTEIILFIMNNSSWPNISDVEEYMSHISEKHNKQLVKELLNRGYIFSEETGDDVVYRLSHETLELINNYTYL